MLARLMNPPRRRWRTRRRFPARLKSLPILIVLIPGIIAFALLELVTACCKEPQHFLAGLLNTHTASAVAEHFRMRPHTQEAAILSPTEHCERLARRGLCARSEKVRADLDRFCPGVCAAMNESDSVAALKQNLDFSVLSVGDWSRFDRSLCKTRAELEKIRLAGCANLEDVGRIKEHGWVIMRGMVPRVELNAMLAQMGRIQEPLRTNCGSSFAHPAGCFHHLSSIAPRFHRKLDNLLNGWIATGFHDDAQLGWPLRVEPSEFLALNHWQRNDASLKCVIDALFMATMNFDDPQRDKCVQACNVFTLPRDLSRMFESQEFVMTAERWLCCWWASLMRLPRQQVRQVIATPLCTRLPPALTLLKLWRADSTSWRKFPMWNEMGWWIANTMGNNSAPFYAGQGYHGWHHDGAANGGRHHKAWLLVSKNGSTGPSSTAAASRSNIVAAPVSARYGLNCRLSPWNFNETVEETIHEYGCEVTMQPGDMLFFREDVWHRTQDIDIDRIALSTPIFRVTPRNAPNWDVPRSIHQGEKIQPVQSLPRRKLK